MSNDALSSLFGLDGKTALVTGGSRGIGYMITGSLLDAGATVMISSRNAEACQEAAGKLSERGPCTGFAGDVSTAEGCEALAEEVQNRHESLDILINNAGASWGAPLDNHPVEGWDKVMDTNVRGPFFLTQKLLPLLTAKATAEDPARVINIGSVDGITSPSWPSFAYSSSKAAIHMLTRHMARDLAPRHILVNAIAPGLFESKMTAFMFDDGPVESEVLRRMPLGRSGNPDEIGGSVVWLSSRAGAYLTGAVIPVSGGYAIL